MCEINILNNSYIDGMKLSMPRSLCVTCTLSEWPCLCADIFNLIKPE